MTHLAAIVLFLTLLSCGQVSSTGPYGGGSPDDGREATAAETA